MKLLSRKSVYQCLGRCIDDIIMMFLSKIFLLDYLKEPFKILNKREGGFCLFSSQHLLSLLLLCTKYYALS